MTFLAVALGGAVGAPARFALERTVSRAFGHRFPWGTLAVNVTGSFVLGLVVASALSGLPRAAVTSGFLGAYTTFSTYAYEAVELGARSGRARACACAYALVTVVASVGAAWLGLAVG